MNAKEQLVKFKQFIEDINQLQSHSIKNKFQRLNDQKSFAQVTEEISLLKNKVYHNRYKQTKSLIKKNIDSIKFSCFELMEHNFRENTHSTILRHIFHHKFQHNGNEILSKFIANTTDDLELAHRILKSNYGIYREKSTKNGRIDLLIEDKNEKFVIVIENKIFANISSKEYLEDNTVTKTQLDNYSEFIESNYPNYKQCFILLSLFPNEDDKIGRFIQTDYTNLINSIAKYKNDSNILNEYYILLNTITKLEFDKEWIFELSNNVMRNKEVNLNILQIINHYFQQYDA